MVGQNKKDTDSIRENAGVNERSFLQESPDGDFVILTFEGHDPVAGWGTIMENLPDEFAAATSTWCATRKTLRRRQRHNLSCSRYHRLFHLKIRFDLLSTLVPRLSLLCSMLKAS